MLKLSSILTAIAVIASWGFNVSIGKIGVLQLEPFAFLGIRFLLTALCFLPFSHLKKQDIPLLILIAFLLNLCHMGSIFISFKFLSVSSVTVLQQSQVPFAILIGCIVAKESINMRQILGIVLAITGIACIFGVPNLNITGAFFALLASLFWGMTQLAFKKSRHISASTYIAYTALFSSPMFFILSFFFEKNVYELLINANQIKFWSVMAYEVFAMAVAFMIWQRLVIENGVNKMAPFTLLQALFGILSGVIFFGEEISAPVIWGTLLTIFGVSLNVLQINIFKRKKKL